MGLREGALMVGAVAAVAAMSYAGFWLGSAKQREEAASTESLAVASDQSAPLSTEERPAPPRTTLDIETGDVPRAGSTSSAAVSSGLSAAEATGGERADLSAAAAQTAAALQGAPSLTSTPLTSEAPRTSAAPNATDGRVPGPADASPGTQIAFADPPPTPLSPIPDTDAPDRAAIEAAAARASEGEAAAADPEAADRPTFDIVRVARDGATVLAGRADPGAQVDVMVDGALAAQTSADGRGEFVVLLQAPMTGAQTLRLDLNAHLSDGRSLASAAPVIVTQTSDPGLMPVVLQPSADGVALLQPEAPSVPGGVTIDTVSYDAEGAVTIAGRGGAGGVARVYLDNALEAEARVNPEGAWSVDLRKNIAPAIYTLRVDQLTAAGEVVARAETPFQRASVDDIVVTEGGVVVQPGNNLWRIAAHVYGDGMRYHTIYRANQTQIRNPDLIYPGQIFDLPGDLVD